jgi:endonuclease/exonuclease/phosphatase (EEP) superfamily protein YafD
MRVVSTIVLAALLPSWLGLLGDWYWLLDLCAHFRWQYLIASVAIAAWALWKRRRVTAALAVATLLLNAWLIGQLAWHPALTAADVVPGFSLRIVSLNVLTSNPDKQAVLHYLQSADADVIFLMETDQRWIEALQPLLAKYPYHLEAPRGDNFGIAMLSRVPWETARIISLGDAGLPSIQAQMHFQQRELTLLGTHPLPPMGTHLTALRNGQLAALARHVQQLGMPTLLMGDLNSTPWSVGVRIATSGNLGFRSMSAPWTPTWRARSPFAIPIDHVLCTPPLVITRRDIGPDVGSDHRPLQITVSWHR